VTRLPRARGLPLFVFRRHLPSLPSFSWSVSCPPVCASASPKNIFQSRKGFTLWVWPRFLPPPLFSSPPPWAPNFTRSQRQLLRRLIGSPFRSDPCFSVLRPPASFGAHLGLGRLKGLTDNRCSSRFQPSGPLASLNIFFCSFASFKQFLSFPPPLPRYPLPHVKVNSLVKIISITTLWCSERS